MGGCDGKLTIDAPAGTSCSTTAAEEAAPASADTGRNVPEREGLVLSSSSSAVAISGAEAAAALLLLSIPPVPPLAVAEPLPLTSAASGAAAEAPSASLPIDAAAGSSDAAAFADRSCGRRPLAGSAVDAAALLAEERSRPGRGAGAMGIGREVTEDRGIADADGSGGMVG